MQPIEVEVLDDKNQSVQYAGLMVAIVTLNDMAVGAVHHGWNFSKVPLERIRSVNKIKIEPGKRKV